MNKTDIISPYNVTAQLPLDAKVFFVGNSTEEVLGENFIKPYSYYKGMIVFCAALNDFFVWNERIENDETPYMLTSDFIYANNVVTNEIDYSNKSYNFFKLLSKPQLPISELKRFIVNSKYEGEEELGTILKPFKNIQNAVDAFIGQSDITAPETSTEDYVIEVEKGIGPYEFTGDISLSGLTLIIKKQAEIISSPEGDSKWFVDIDKNAGSFQQFSFNMIMEEGSVLRLNKGGFRNSGNNIDSETEAIQGKTITIDGHSSAKIISNIKIRDIERLDNHIFGMNINNNLSKNNGELLLSIDNVTVVTSAVKILELNKGKVNLGKTRFVIGTQFEYMDEALPPFVINNGAQVYSEKASFINNSQTKVRKLFDLYGNKSLLNLINPIFEGIFSRIVDVNGFIDYSLDPLVKIINSTYLKQIIVDYILVYNRYEGSDEIYIGANIDGCKFTQANIDSESVDLTMNNTISVSNKMANCIVKNLVKFEGRETASLYGLKPYSEFINTEYDNEDTQLWHIDILIPLT